MHGNFQGRLLGSASQRHSKKGWLPEERGLVMPFVLVSVQIEHWDFVFKFFFDKNTERSKKLNVLRTGIGVAENNNSSNIGFCCIVFSD